MLFGSAIYDAYPRLPTALPSISIRWYVVNDIHSLSSAKEDRHHDGMGEPNLDTVHEPVSGTLQDCQIVMECGIVDDTFDGSESRHSCDRYCQAVVVDAR